MSDSSAEKTVMLRLSGVKKSYGDTLVLKNIDLTVAKGEVLAVIGPSGSGKSTMLRCMNRLETIDAGRIEVMGEVLVQNDANGRAVYAPDDVSRRLLGEMGMVFQQFNLFPHKTVMENLLLAPTIVKGQSADEATRTAAALLQKVGLYEKRDLYPKQLSGGQQQRVAIARALAMRPEILLFDEPTSALDPELTVEVLKTIHELAEEHMTMVVVTHEMNFARDVANKVIFMADGVVVEEGEPGAFFAAPREERTRSFLQSMNADA